MNRGNGTHDGNDFRNDFGATMVEYALLVGLIALVCIASASFMGQKVSVKYSNIAKEFE